MQNTVRFIADWFRHWHFDIKSGIFTVLILPFVYFLLKLLLTWLKRIGSYALEGVLYLLSRYLIHTLSARISLKRYCRLQLQTEKKYLFIPSTSEVKLELDDIFVGLTMDNPGNQQEYSDTDILKAANRIRVIGDPGSGKSSLAKKLLRDACNQAIKAPRKSRLPVMIELKTLQPPKNLKPHLAKKWLFNHLEKTVAETSVYRMDECFRNYAQTAGLLVLLDGLDEVSSKDYARVHALIDGLDKTLEDEGPRNIIVLTMRTQFYQQIKDSYRMTFGASLFIKPFTPTDIYTFLTKWRFQSDRNSNISRIYKDLTDRPSLREMCTNPLILSMYVAEDQTSKDIIALDSRTQFYSRIIEELILKRRFKQTGIQPAPTTLKEQRERVLGKVCFDHLLNSDEPANSLSWKKGVKATQAVFRGSYEQAERQFREISSETGLFTEERSSESFRFIHLTVCEFLAAFEGIEGQASGWKDLLRAHRGFLTHSQPQMQTRLAEVIPFACGLLPRVHRPNAISEIYSLNDLRLLARCFFETKSYDHESWKTFVKKTEEAILNTPENKWDNRWLSDLHLLNLVVRDAALSSHHRGTSESIEDLAPLYTQLAQGQQQDSLAKLLNTCASQDAATAFRIAEICQLDLPSAFPNIVVKIATSCHFSRWYGTKYRKIPNGGNCGSLSSPKPAFVHRLWPIILHRNIPMINLLR